MGGLRSCRRVCVLVALALCLGRLAACRIPGVPAGEPDWRAADFAFVRIADVDVPPVPPDASPEPDPARRAAFDWLARSVVSPAEAPGAERLGPPASFLVVSGNLTAAGAPGATWARVRALLDTPGLPWFVTPGTHDTWPESYGRIFRDRHGTWNYSFDQAGWHFVCLLSASLQSPEPAMDAATLTWLAADLARAGTERPIVVVTALAPDDPALAQPVQLARFLDAVERYRIELVLAGPGAPGHRRVAGIDVVTGGGFAPGSEAATRVRVAGDRLLVTELFRDPSRPPRILLDKRVADGPREGPFELLAPGLREVVPATGLAVRVRSPDARRVEAVPGRGEPVPLALEGEEWTGVVPADRFGPGANLLRILGADDPLGPPTHHRTRIVYGAGAPQVLWRRPLGLGVQAAPLPDVTGGQVAFVARNGLVVGSDQESGRELWRRQLGGAALATPVRAAGGLVVGTGDGAVSLVRPGGEVAWSVRVDRAVHGPPLSDGRTVWVMDNGGRLHAFDAFEGRKTWTFTGERRATGSRPARFGELVVFRSGAGTVVGVEAETGALRWRAQQEPLDEPPRAAADAPVRVLGERVLVPDRLGRVFAYDAGGTGRPLPLEGVLSIGVDPGGSFAVVRTAGGLRRIDADGRVAWEAALELGASAAEPIVRDGTVVVCSLDGVLHSLDAADGRVLWSYLASPGSLVLAAPAIGADGTIYLADVDGTLTALRAPPRGD